MNQLTRYFISRLVGPGVVTVALDEGGKGSAEIACEATGEQHRACYAVDLAGWALKSPPREDVVYQVCRRAISQLQQEARACRPCARKHLLEPTIAPWNGDLYEAPPLSTIDWTSHGNAGRLPL